MANNDRSVSTSRRANGKSKLTIYCDGRCRQNSEGLKGSWSFVVENGEGQITHEQSGFCENDANVTNIVAEYQAVIEGLRWAYFCAGDSFEICTSLELIEQQVSGRCRVKAAKLMPLRNEVRELLDTMKASLRWIPKGQHKRAALLTRDAYRQEHCEQYTAHEPKANVSKPSGVSRAAMSARRCMIQARRSRQV